ncbi:NAC domain-containing protein [Rhizoctonia solani]|uniref:Nascent polypeptide-associated complex subunit beta n=1 Tax=Rhizoctonia solani TaxID=456999 RepID=A0A8H8SWE5_9AGAM
MNAEKLAKLQAAAAANRIGGKGSVRRKVVPRSGPKAAGGDDKKLAAALKKLNVQPIAPIEEVNMFQVDGSVLHFTAPKVHGAHSSNTFAVYGAGHVKDLTELVPGILNQLGPDSLANLRRLAESYQSMQARAQAAQGAGAPGADDDDEVPALIGTESFEVPEGDKPADAAEPAATEPAATEPAATEPTATEPAAEATTEATKANDVD